MSARVLIADDDPAVRAALAQVFRAEGYEVDACRDGNEALARAAEVPPDVAFVDLAMPGQDGLSVLERLRAADPALPVVVVTAYGALDSAVRAVQMGAYEYLSKPLDLQRLRSLAKRALEVRALSRRVSVLERRVGRAASHLVGRHPSMIEVFKRIGAFSAPGNRSTVLVAGESGTGKELVARAIHDASDRAREPFVVCDCAAMSESLVESELFGHERGAFTGAVQRRAGRLETAGRGTVFLDEVGELSPAVQQKLLRVLETGEFDRVGGGTARCEARFIAATHRDLRERVAEGRFREDLYWRLNVLVVELPPLRARADDIPLLVDALLDRISAVQGRERVGISGEALDALRHYRWPGNVRELEHVLERAVASCRGPSILPEDVVLPDAPAPPAVDATATVPLASPRYEESRRYLLDLFERRFVEAALAATGGNVTEAAERAGIERQSFQRLMHRHGIRSADFRG